MHTLLLIISFTILYLALKYEYHKIERAQSWKHRSGLACYILCSTVLFLFSVTLNFWLMYITGCIAFHTHDWDTTFGLALGILLWVSLGWSIIKTFISQGKVQQVMKLVSPCQHPETLALIEALSAKLAIKVPHLCTYRSNKPYAATLFWKSPVVLLSTWTLETLDPEELEAVLAHELAHIQRKDNLMVSIAGILKDVLFFLPTIQKTWKKFLIDLETAADDLAVIATRNPTALASALVRVHKEQPEIQFAYGISYFTSNYDHLEHRVERLLSPDAERFAEAASVRFSALLFSKDILISAGLLIAILCSIYFIPYCHWMVNHNL